MNSISDRFNSDTVRQWANLIAIVVAFAVNVYANISPPLGLTIGDISNTLFQGVLIIPASYAFSIWGLIYVGLFAFGVYQVLPAQKENPYLRRIGYFLVVASLAQCLWVVVFLYRQFLLSVIAMLGILVPLIGLYWRLNIARERVSKKERWFIQFPVSIYLGWISVATIVNVASALYDRGWQGGGISPVIWTMLMLVVASAIAAIVHKTRADIAYPLVIIWALVAILFRQANEPLLVATAGGLAFIIGILVLVDLLRRPSL